MTGGSHYKKMSRKQNASSFNYDALNNPNIVDVSVSQALGNCRFFVLNRQGDKLTMHIPGRFSGRNKHRNFVTVNSLVKVQLRELEQPVKNCDYLQMIQATTPLGFFLNSAAKPMDDLEERILFKHVEAEDEEENKKVGNLRTATTEDLDELQALESMNFDDI